MTKCIVPYPENCTGCRSCELICTLHHEKLSNRRKARIRIVKSGVKVDIPVVCSQCTACGDACCLNVCPEEAISLSGEAVIVNEERCTGCGACERSCPFGVIRVFGTAKKCDLCSGDPVCVKFCPYGAIRYEEPKPEQYQKVAEMLEALK